jgi:hypothetical protein
MHPQFCTYVLDIQPTTPTCSHKHDHPLASAAAAPGAEAAAGGPRGRAQGGRYAPAPDPNLVPGAVGDGWPSDSGAAQPQPQAQAALASPSSQPLGWGVPADAEVTARPRRKPGGYGSK